MYDKKSDDYTLNMSNVTMRLDELRAQVTSPGLTGKRRDQLIQTIVRLETEKAKITAAYNVETGQSKREELDERDQAIKEAERLEATGVEADAKIARGIRQGIINSEFKAHQAEEQHRIDAEQADQTRQANAEAEALQRAKQEAELQAALNAEDKKAS